MRYRSKLWTRLAARGRFNVQSALVIDGKKYDKISAPKIDRALMSDPLSVGNCITATLRVSVMTDDSIPEAADIVVRARLTDEKRYSEWMDFGTFFLDQRVDNYEGLLTFTAYDAMKKTEQDYIDPDTVDTTNWPKTMIDCVEEIATRIGVGIDQRTRIKTGPDYVVPCPEKGMSMKQVLGYIGGVHAGNWIITEDNKLRLVPLISAPDETFNIIDEYYNPIVTGGGNRLAYRLTGKERVDVQPVGSGTAPAPLIPQTWHVIDDQYNPIVTKDGYYLVWGNDSYAAVGGLINVPIVLGGITTGKDFIVSKVTMSGTTGDPASYGDDSGIEVKITGNPYATNDICEELYNELKGLEYRPFSATKARYDPATELGDWIKIGDTVRSVLYVSQITLGVDFLSDVSAPTSDEITSEYPYPDRIQALQRNMSVVQRGITTLQTSINRVDGRIDLEVQTRQNNETIADSRLSVLENEVFIEVTDGTGETKRESKIETLVSGIKLTTTSKDGQAYLHLDNGEDSSDVALTLSATDPDGNKKSTLTLKSGSTTLSSTSITLSGVVTFTELEDENSTTTIEGAEINTGTINAEDVVFSAHTQDGKGGGFRCATGSAGEDANGNTIVTFGAMMYGWETGIEEKIKNGEDPSYYFIATDKGVRMQAPIESFYISGNTIKASKDITIGSDRRIKHSIDYDMSRYEPLFHLLKPVAYKYNRGTSDRFHTGFIAQDVEDAIITAGLTTQDFAAFVIEPEAQGGQYGLCYSEFISLNTHMIQQALERIKALENQVKALGGTV